MNLVIVLSVPIHSPYLYNTNDSVLLVLIVYVLDTFVSVYTVCLYSGTLISWK